MSGAQWARLAKATADRFTVVVPDLIGSGRTADRVGTTLADDVAAVVALLETLPAPAVLVGHSYGGLVAVEAALRAPTRVRALALYEPVILALAGEAGSDVAKAQLARIPTLMAGPVDDGGRAWVEGFVDWWNGAGFFSRLTEAVQAQNVATALVARRQVEGVGQQTLTRARVATIAVPTLVLTGETSPEAARESAAIAVAAMPNATLRTIAGAGHMGPLTHGAVVVEAMLAFLAADAG